MHLGYTLMTVGMKISFTIAIKASYSLLNKKVFMLTANLEAEYCTSLTLKSFILQSVFDLFIERVDILMLV